MYKVLIIFLLTPFIMIGQKSGKVTYDMTIKVEIPDRVPQQFRDRIPKEQKVIKELYFDESESNYKTGERAEEEAGIEENEFSRRFRRRFGRGMGTGQTYKDIAGDKMIDKRNLMDKDFVIYGILPEYKWKVTGQKKQVLTYLVMEATTTVGDSIAVSAWFAPQIPVSNGPGTYQGLPGLILELNIDNGKQVIVANNVALGPIEDGIIEIPSKGKEVTMEEFEAIRKEKTKEMREQRGAGGLGNGRGRGGA
ncbi:MAG: GLPGLI family protein [Saprospiraceae bacterium]|jgi:GLPGLI family protein